MTKRLRFTLLLTAGVLFVMLLFGLARRDEPVVSLAGARALTHDIYNSVYAPGELEAERQSEFAAARPALAAAVYVQPGDWVEAGQTLVRLKDTAPAVDKETVGAFAQGVLAGDAADGGALAAALPTEGEEYDIVADMAGTVLSAPEEGDSLLPGLTYLKIADTSHLRVRAEIPETYIGQVRAGQRANVTAAAADGVTAGQVRAVAPYARRAVSFTGQQNAATVTTVLDLLGAQEGLRPGYTVDVKIFTDTVKDAVLVPYEAVTQRNGAEYVAVAEEGRARWIPVETGYELNGYLQVKSGVAAGDMVLLSPPETLCDGDLVEVTDS